jgi:hypothetical protein
MKKGVLILYRMEPRMLGFGGQFPTLGPLESVANLGLSVVFREPYSASILQFWYILIDIRFILLHVEFEEGLSISVVKNRATRYEKLQLES